MVDRLVELAVRRVDLELAEHRVHAKGASFVRDDGHDARTELLVSHHRAERCSEDHRRRNFAAARTLVEVIEDALFWQRQWAPRAHDPLRQRSTELGSALLEVLHFHRIWCGLEVRRDATLEVRFGNFCLLYTSPSPRDQRGSRMPSSA